MVVASVQQLPVAGEPGQDIEELYRRFSGRLERIVRLGVHAPEPVIEDACQFAWIRLIHHCDRVRRETLLAWLATTAVHEALKLLRRSTRELSLDAALEETGEGLLDAHAPAADELYERLDRIAAVGRLPVRQQRLLWLQALGLSYAEMAAYEGYTTRTVERQLLRARTSMRLEAEGGEDGRGVAR
jgi:RNA polymerase sigma factor (sigma-70 family)